MALQNRRWICGGDCDAPIIGKTITLPQISSASIDICVLGFFEMYINDTKVSEDVLNPACSQLDKSVGKDLLYPINDTFSGSRVYYRQYDITNYFVLGDNKIEFYLGNGWYNQKDRVIEGNFAHGVPRICFEIELEYVNGQTQMLVSDDTFMWKPSYIKYNNIFYGEKHDYSQKSNCDEPKRVQYCDGTDSPLVLQKCPSDKIIRRIEPKLMSNFGKKKVYDCGENITGWVSFKSMKHTKKVVITFAEEITADGRLDFASTGYEDSMEQLQKDEFIFDGEQRVCRPKFTWHGFRYFELEGDVCELAVEVVHADVTQKAEFNCDNDLLNRLFDAFKRSMLGNMHCGVVSDCPHRERIGYTGDAQNTADTAMLVFDADEMYSKIIRDIADTQDINTGHIQHTAPFFGGGGGPGGWGCAIVTIPYAHYKQYGNAELLKSYYPNMLKYISYMQSRCENDLVVVEEKDGWCLGEWCTASELQIPAEFVNTYFLVKSLMLMKEIAEIIGEPTAVLDEYESKYKKALRDNFYDEVKNTYCGGANGADAFAADIGMADEACISAINQKYQNQKFDTGIFGTTILLKVLFENGYADTSFKLLTEKGKDTFYEHHIELGATTLWETWADGASHNHHMFGAVISTFFYYILGITVSDRLVLEPKMIKKLGYASGSVRTRFGEVFVSYERTENGVHFDILSENDTELIYNGRTYPICGGEYCAFDFCEQ